MELVVTVLTAPFSGGIGVVLVAGRGARGVVASRFHGAKPGDLEPDSVRYGWLREEGQAGAIVDEVLVRVRRDDDLGVEAVEVSGHGGRASVRAITKLFVDAGARESSPTELVRCVAPYAGIDHVRVDAIEALPRAASLEAAIFLLGAFEGTLTRAACAAAADPSAVRALLARAPRGIALVSPREIVLLGRPNVGKSSLFNALLGRDRAITSAVPGTTRDLLDGMIVASGYPIRIVDSAGVEVPRDRIQRAGIERSLFASREAHLRVVLLDSSKPIDDDDRRIVDLATSAGTTILAATQCDRPWRLECDLEIPVRTSAVTGEGLDDLRDHVCRALGLAEPPPRADEPAPFNERQVRALEVLASGAPGGLGLLLGSEFGTGSDFRTRGVFP
ncbi:MAG: 50S ribosome-binding GTPase [Planctomycetes bacterium]|nr:50S ribosome-binding GTPase [Planctomycetota bacterium]